VGFCVCAEQWTRPDTGTQTGRAPPRRRQWHVNTSKLNECTEEVLTSFKESTSASAGECVGSGPDFQRGNNATITVTNDTTAFTVRGLTDLYNRLRQNNPAWGWPALGPGVTIVGFTDPFNPYQTWTARNVDQRERLATQVHELGHALDLITGGNINPRAPNDERGFKLEECMQRKGGFVLT